MPAFKVINADDNKQGESAEVVGSANLSDVLKEKHQVRGSFWLNGTEFRDFEAHSPGEVARKINARSSRTGVRASIDDGFHLVLEGDGSGEIQIASGHASDQHRRRLSVASRNDNLSPAQRDQAQRDEQKDKEQDTKDVLELLGLKANAQASDQSGADWMPGESAEQRKKRREDESKRGVGRARSIMGGADAAEDARIAERQGREGGGTTTLNQGPSDPTATDPHQPPRASRGTEQDDHADDGMGRAPPTGPRPGTTSRTKEKPSL